ncbi:MAG: dTDP-4-dehydrorhamnose reductase [Actinobacteria bacterium ATB1]|nr:dTDP-4-dehydrorhamnose reductase [Actinobacteria bacterium ATB1]
MRVAIVGATGQLGHALCQAFSDWEVTPLGSSACDIADYESVMGTMYACGPDLIVNAAAMTAVDACETEIDRAFAVNALGPRNLALAANALDADLVHVSSDYVFEGTAGRPYDEWDEPWPLSVYGRSKLGGEREIQHLRPQSYVVRTAVLFSTQAPNFALSILRAADSPGRLQVVSDQIGSPTYAPHLARAIRKLAVSGRYGLYHLAGSGACSRADLAREILAVGGHEPDRIENVATDAMLASYPAPRPANSSLECRAWHLAGGEPLPTWQEGVRDLISDLGHNRGAPPSPAPPPPDAEQSDRGGDPTPEAEGPVQLTADLDVTDDVPGGREATGENEGADSSSREVAPAASTGQDRDS